MSLKFSSLVLICCLLFLSKVSAQNLDWQTTVTSTPITGSLPFDQNQVEIKDVHASTSGTIYSCGRFDGAHANFGSALIHGDSSTIPDSHERWNGFIAAQNQSGAVLWTRSITCKQSVSILSFKPADLNMPSKICTGPEGSVYLAGLIYSDTVLVDGVMIPTGIAPAEGDGNLGYLLKFDAAGNLIWSRFWAYSFNPFIPLSLYFQSNTVCMHVWSDGIFYNGTAYPTSQGFLMSSVLRFQPNGTFMSFADLPAPLSSANSMLTSSWSPKMKRLVVADNINSPASSQPFFPSVHVYDSTHHLEFARTIGVLMGTDTIGAALAETVKQDKDGNVLGMVSILLPVDPGTSFRFFSNNQQVSIAGSPVASTSGSGSSYWKIIFKLSPTGCLLFARFAEEMHNGSLAILDNGGLAGIKTNSLNESSIGNIPVGNSRIISYDQNAVKQSNTPEILQDPTEIWTSNGVFFGIVQGHSSVAEIPNGFIGAYGRSLFKITWSSLPNPGVDSLAYITTNGPASFCEGGSIQLDGHGGASYVWQPGNSTTASINAVTAGTYTLAATNEAGCTSYAQVNVAVNPIPVVNAGPNQSAVVNTDSLLLVGTPAGGTWTCQGSVLPGRFNTNRAPGNYSVLYCVTQNGCTACDSLEVSLTGQMEEGVQKPVISPGSGTFDGPQSITLSTTTLGATLYYTTSGNVPVPGTSFTKIYTAPFMVYESSTVRAMAIKPLLKDSPVAVSHFTIANPGIVAQPVISPGSGTFSSAQLVGITCSTPEAQIYYTTNGNNPRLDVANSYTRLYSGPFQVGTSMNIRAIAVKSGLLNSPLQTANLTFTTPATTGTISMSPSPGMFADPVAVTLSCTTPDAQIYYTLNGNNPRLDVPNFFTRLYSTPVQMSSSRTLRAVAVKAGLTNSPIAVGIYTIGGAIRKATDTQPMGEEVEIGVYPNPGDGLFQVKLPFSEENEMLQLVVYNTLGAAVWRKESASGNSIETLDLKRLPRGVYQLEVTTGVVRKMIRIVKN